MSCHLSRYCRGSVRSREAHEEEMEDARRAKKPRVHGLVVGRTGGEGRLPRVRLPTSMAPQARDEEGWGEEGGGGERERPESRQGEAMEVEATDGEADATIAGCAAGGGGSEKSGEERGEGEGKGTPSSVWSLSERAGNPTRWGMGMGIGMGMGMGMGMGVETGARGKTQPLRPKTIRPVGSVTGGDGGPRAWAPAAQEDEEGGDAGDGAEVAGLDANDGDGNGAEPRGPMMLTTVTVGGTQRVMPSIMPQPFSMPLLPPLMGLGDGAMRRLSLPASWRQFNDEQYTFQQRHAAAAQAEVKVRHGFIPPGARAATMGHPGPLLGSLLGSGGSAWQPEQGAQEELLGASPLRVGAQLQDLQLQGRGFEVALQSQLVRLQHQNASLEVRQVQADRALEQAEIVLEEDAEAAERRRRKGKEHEVAEGPEGSGAEPDWDSVANRRQVALSQIAKARKMLHLGEGE